MRQQLVSGQEEKCRDSKTIVGLDRRVKQKRKQMNNAGELHSCPTFRCVWDHGKEVVWPNKNSVANSCVFFSWMFSWMEFSVEVRRLRSDGENLLAQTEREKQALTQTLNAAQLEAQQALRKAVSEHQEEVERLVSEKVRRFSGSKNTDRRSIPT